MIFEKVTKNDEVMASIQSIFPNPKIDDQQLKKYKNNLHYIDYKNTIMT